jgi:hypothetical protein
VKDVVTALKAGERLGAKQAVGIGDDADNHSQAIVKQAKKKRPGLMQYQDATAALPQNCLTTSGF